jgi:diamine N-acetyltransferase
MIEGNRVKLRAIEDLDVSFYHQWINDQETNFWRGLYHPVAFDVAQNDLKIFKFNDHTKLSLSIVAAADKPIGFVGLRGICCRSRRGEIWIYIGDKSFWSKGFGQEILSLLVRYAFEEMNLHRLWLECDPEHKSAVACYEKVGFKQEGVLKESYYRRGSYRDTIIMGLIRDRIG